MKQFVFWPCAVIPVMLALILTPVRPAPAVQYDLIEDGVINGADVGALKTRWLDDCSPDDWCDGKDLDQSGRVDLFDFVALVQQWLDNDIPDMRAALSVQHITASAGNNTWNAINTVNGLGLDPNDFHDTSHMTAWYTSLGYHEPHPFGLPCENWLRYDFDDVYNLGTMWVWNFNQVSGDTDLTDRGIKKVRIHYSTTGGSDIAEWTELGSGYTFAKATGQPDYAHNTEIDFGLVPARHVVITIDPAEANWGNPDVVGLSEVRFGIAAKTASHPHPTDNDAGVPVTDTYLTWWPGDLTDPVDGHDVYFGTDFNDVNTADTTVYDPNNVYMGRQSEPYYLLGTLEPNTVYYWRIDQVSSSHQDSPWKGPVWQFRTCSGPAASAYYVATDGDDNNPGTLQAPFRTLERARDAIRYSCSRPDGGVTVYIRAGKYFLENQFSLTGRDSGTAAKPVVLQAYNGESVRIIGGTELDPDYFTLVTPASPIWTRLSPAAQGNVMQCNLPAHGITDYGRLRIRGYYQWAPSHMELCFNGEIMQLARWPNVNDDPNFAAVVQRIAGDKFKYSGTRPSNWLNASDPWIFGYWYWDWVDWYTSIVNIDTANQTIRLGSYPPGDISTNGVWYALNILEELDSPGEWYLERNDGMLYFWPPGDIGSAEILVSTLGDDNSLISIDGAEHILIKDITFELGRNGGISVTDSDNVVIDGCTFRNIGGRSAVTITGGSHCGVQDCRIHDVDTGIRLTGGDRYTLTSAFHFARNNHIHHFSRWGRTYNPAVWLMGVGNEVSHNLIHDAPHAAILYGANDQGANEMLIQYNEIHHVCTYSGDTGAIYTRSGWTNRGSIVQHNFIHDVPGSVSIYFDDGSAGHTVIGNILYNNHEGVAINGGRDVITENNVVANSDNAINCNRSGPIQFDCTPGATGNWLEQAEEFNYRNPPWSTTYPELAAIDNTCAAFEAAANPEGCTFSRNVGYNNVQWMVDGGWGGYGAYDYFDSIEYNDPNVAPLFVDEPNMVMALRDDSPAYNIPGFQRIEWERMGRLDRRKAVRPLPPDGWTGVGTNVTLYWAPAFEGLSRDVYLDTNFAAVSNRDPAALKQQTTATSYTPPAALQAGTTYYWCIDERDSKGSLLQAGDVWSFTTQAP